MSTHSPRDKQKGAEGNVKLVQHYFRPTAYFPLCDGPLFVFTADRVSGFLLGPQGHSLNSSLQVNAGTLSEPMLFRAELLCQRFQRNTPYLEKPLISLFHLLKFIDFQEYLFRKKKREHFANFRAEPKIPQTGRKYPRQEECLPKAIILGLVCLEFKNHTKQKTMIRRR